MRRLISAALILVVTATACSNAGEDTTLRTIDVGRTDAVIETAGPGDRTSIPLPVPGDGSPTATAGSGVVTGFAAQTRSDSTLSTFSDCDSLLGHIRDEALERVGPYGLDHGQYGSPFEEEEFIDDESFIDDILEDGFFDDMGDDMDGEAAPASDAPTDSGGAAGAEYSTTNVQVTGVDEPDIVKTDGRRILTLSKGVLSVVDVTGATPEVLGHVLLNDVRNGELLLRGDRALAIRNHTGGLRPYEEADEQAGQSSEIVAIDEVLLDGVPRRGRSMRVEGRYVSSRSTGSTARIVINSFPGDPGFVRPLDPVDPSLATKTNRRIIESTTLADWLPDYTLVGSDGSVLAQETRLLDCDRVHVPEEFAGFAAASVLTIDLAEPLAPDNSAATFAVAETVYASLQNLYVATSDWVSKSVLADAEQLVAHSDRYATAIHKFSLDTSGAASYEASGLVEGHLLNQFALHELDGHLFAATTDGPPWRFRATESRIVALSQQGNELVEVGQVGNMGRGERIYAVRYIADRAYVVTFRQIDPLYVVDLGDPTQPAILGELKIPGFSSYLHPIGDGLLVGVGRDVTESGWDRGVKISLFDVSDATDPREIDTWTLEGAYTDVGADHRSFLWWSPEQLVVLPVSFRYAQDGSNGAYAFKVTRSDGLSEFGRVDHSRDGRDREPLRRSLVIGEDLWTMSASLLQRNDLETLSRVDSVALPSADDPQVASAVVRYSDCNALLDRIVMEAVSRVGAHGFDRGRYTRTSARSDGTSPPTLTVGDAASIANLIDTDGRRIVTAIGRVLSVVDITGSEPRVVNRLRIPFDRTTGLVLHGDSVFVIGEQRPIPPDPRRMSSSTEHFGDAVVVREFLLDGVLRHGTGLFIEGHLESARASDGSLYLAMRSSPRHLGLVYPLDAHGEALAAEVNRQAIAQSTLQNWLPRYGLVTSVDRVVREDNLVSCDDVVVPEEFSGFGTAFSVTIDLEEPLAPRATTAIFAEDTAVHATDESFYVATEPWPTASAFRDAADGARGSSRRRTAIHRFARTDGEQPAYEASGVLVGDLIGSSPMHEHAGHLFVAVEEDSPDSEGRLGAQHIVALEQQQDRLVTVGRSGDLSGADRVSVVRYVNDRAFTHSGHPGAPIRVIDLRDPSQPSPRGELGTSDNGAISSSLHAVGDGQLALVANLEPSWDPDLQVSLLDTSGIELSELGTWTGDDLFSQAASAPNSLVWWGAAHLMIVPIQDGRSGQDKPHGVALLRLGPGEGVAYIGHVSPAVDGRELVSEVTRSLIIGDSLWTLSQSNDGGWLLQSNNLETLERQAGLRLTG